MPVADDLVARVAQLPPDELEDLLARVGGRGRPAGTNGATPLSNIVRTPGVCGGSARIIRTRIPVWVLEQFRRLGTSEADILKAYPSLRAIDLVEAWQYADAHVEEMDREIRENEED
jgi:uncharacterized protein (DUF433 family)